jgi:hypothetical protein
MSLPKYQSKEDYNSKYYWLHKEHIKKKSNEYYHKNKSSLLQKIKCINCDGQYCLKSMSAHFQTKKHLLGAQRTLWNEIEKFEKEEDNEIDNLFY